MKFSTVRRDTVVKVKQPLRKYAALFAAVRDCDEASAVCVEGLDANAQNSLLTCAYSWVRNNHPQMRLRKRLRDGNLYLWLELKQESGHGSETD